MLLNLLHKTLIESTSVMIGILLLGLIGSLACCFDLVRNAIQAAV